MYQKLKFFSLLKGIPRYKYTLSSIGGPCHFDYTLHSSLDSHFSCAICVPNCHQCGPYTKVPLKKFSNGQYCTKGEAVRRCYGKSRLSHDLQLKSPLYVDICFQIWTAEFFLSHVIPMLYAKTLLITPMDVNVILDTLEMVFNVFLLQIALIYAATKQTMIT